MPVLIGKYEAKKMAKEWLDLIYESIQKDHDKLNWYLELSDRDIIPGSEIDEAISRLIKYRFDEKDIDFLSDAILDAAHNRANTKDEINGDERVWKEATRIILSKIYSYKKI